MNTKKYVCSICGISFDNSLKYRGHLGGHKTRDDKENLKLPRVKLSKVCPKCGVSFEIERVIRNGEVSSLKDERQFCSKKCANSRKQSNQTREKIGIGVKKASLKKVKRLSLRLVKTCPICLTTFSCFPSVNRIYCSRECYNKDNEHQFRKQAVGGYREGSGHSYSGYYKGIYCGSTYELVWVIYQLDHQIPFKRFNSLLQSKGKKYYPDFLQDGKIIEIKGFYSKNVDKQIEVAIDNNYEIRVLYREDLEKEFNYVYKYYGKDLKSLYHT